MDSSSVVSKSTKNYQHKFNDFFDRFWYTYILLGKEESCPALFCSGSDRSVIHIVLEDLFAFSDQNQINYVSLVSPWVVIKKYWHSTMFLSTQLKRYKKSVTSKNKT